MMVGGDIVRLITPGHVTYAQPFSELKSHCLGGGAGAIWPDTDFWANRVWVHPKHSYRVLSDKERFFLQVICDNADDRRLTIRAWTLLRVHYTSKRKAGACEYGCMNTMILLHLGISKFVG